MLRETWCSSRGRGWSLRRADFLLTRLLEVVVHSDDLAASIGVPTPEFPDETFAPVRDLLVRLAVRRHGRSALIGTLARRERARPLSEDAACTRL